jgi:hypothetical protein
MDRKGKFKVSTSLVARSQFPSLPAAKEAKQESLGKQTFGFLWSMQASNYPD